MSRLHGGAVCAVLVATAFAGCGDSSSSETGARTTTEFTIVQSEGGLQDLDRLTVTRSGGKTGRREVLTLTGEGDIATGTVQRDGSDAQPISVVEEEATILEGNLDRFAQSDPPERQIKPCADCYTYDISLLWRGQRVHTTANDVGALGPTQGVMVVVSSVLARAAYS